MAKTIRPKTSPQCRLVGMRVMEMGRATKRKQAYIKIALDDADVEKFIKDECAPFGERKTSSLALTWEEVIVPEPITKKKAKS